MIVTLGLFLLFGIIGAVRDRTARTDDSTGPRDDAEMVLARMGTPDADESSENEKPRPGFVTRSITYRRHRVRFLFVLDPAKGAWKLFGAIDPVSQEALTADDIKHILSNP